MMPLVRSLSAGLRHCALQGTERQFAEGTDPSIAAQLNNDFRYWARPDQLPPDGDHWHAWLVLGGRGSGKTRTGAEYVKSLATGLWHPPLAKTMRIAIVAPTFDEARMVMIEGESGCSPSTRTRSGRSSNHRNGWSPGPMARLRKCSRRRSRKACAADSMPPGATSWPNGNTARRFGPCCSLRCEWASGLAPSSPPRRGPTRLMKRLLADPATVVSQSDHERQCAPSCAFLHGGGDAALCRHAA